MVRDTSGRSANSGPQNGWLVIHLGWNDGSCDHYRTGYWGEGDPVAQYNRGILAQFMGDLGFVGQRWFGDQKIWSDETFIVINQHAYADLSVSWQLEMLELKDELKDGGGDGVPATD